MAQWPGAERLRDWHRANQRWLAANDACRRDVLDRLTRSGPLPSRELPDTCVVPWSSTGWTNDKNITRLLEFLVASGEVAVAGRAGRDRLWDLAERVYPDDPVVPAEEALRRRERTAPRGRWVWPGRAVRCTPASRRTSGRPASRRSSRAYAVSGGSIPLSWGSRSPGGWRCCPRSTGWCTTGSGRVEIFGFEYQLEMYKPVAQRRWGYFALPILSGDALVGKLDATADRKAGVLRVDAIHQDVPFDGETAAGVRAEIDALARWLGLEVSLARVRQQ